MYLAFLKVGDIASRSIFLLIVLYSLPTDAAGQFGLVVTLVAFISFFCGFERYLDIQRNLTAASNAQVNQLILGSARFYFLNLALVAIPFYFLIVYWASLSTLEVLAVFLVIAGEHLSNEVYRYSVILVRLRGLIRLSLAKNLVMVSYVLIEPSLSLEHIIVVWGGVNLVHVIVTCATYYVLECRRVKFTLSPVLEDLIACFTKSKIHFLVGFLAWSSLQGDRFIVSAILPLEQVGIYFRQVFLAAAIYQIATTFSFNRVLSKVYMLISQRDMRAANRVLKIESSLILVFACIILFSIYNLEFLNVLGIQEVRYFVSIVSANVLSGLVLGYVFRILADYNAMLLNALHKEKFIFYAQGGAFVVGSLLNVILTYQLGLIGTVYSVLIGNVVYFFISSVAVSILKRNQFVIN